MWPIHTIVFDLDDTLFAEEQYVLSGFKSVDAWLRRQLSIEGFHACATELFVLGKRGNIFDLALEKIGWRADPALVAQMVEVYRDHEPLLDLLPDAARCLSAVRARYRLALLSDGYLAVQRRKFAALRIADQFDPVVFTDALGGRAFWKPNPAGFRLIMERVGKSPAGFLYVGDNPKKDFIAPRALGWKTVRVRRTSGEHVSYEPAANEKPDSEINSLDQLWALVCPTPSAAEDHQPISSAKNREP